MELCYSGKSQPILCQCFSTYSLQQNPLQQLWLLTKLAHKTHWSSQEFAFGVLVKTKIWGGWPRAGKKFLGRGQRAPSSPPHQL